MRNKIILAMAAAGMMCASSAFADLIPTSDAGGGTMTFTGSVIEAPCNIVPESQNIKVDLGQVSTSTLKTKNHSDLVPVTITLTGCSFEAVTEAPQKNGATGNYSKVAVTFPGVTPPASGTLTEGEIANTASSPADGVAIQLLKGDGATPVDLSKAPTEGDITLDTSSATNKLNFFARMMLISGKTPTQGAVGATVTYKLKYF
ncbi:long polar fimbrial protein LpfA [Salmonella enterica subsp. enterica serovar Oslo]|nr:long polar fimbrial protein LpfA [Salmonella enterica subsp. enterica serovar Oslo]ECG6796649.1 long polar fimbrial protein LpfA [Salmonella enterica subsp. enterica serovar Oslo]EGM7048168.1 fimbrial protein [Salmonella enterica subsp. enterica serovar Oslo]